MERLQKYMAKCGVASRRKCEELILQGKVSVNNTIITELGYKVEEENDIIKVNNVIIYPEAQKVYIALNKPVKYISSVKDEKGRKNVIDLIDVKERIYPIGRLDYDSSGLLLLTNDGDIYNNLMHPSKEVYKTYLVTVNGIPTIEEIKKLETGIDIGGYITAPAKVKIEKLDYNKASLKIQIYEGKNRQIRKMCDSIGHSVIALKRIAIGDIKLKDIPQGKYRFLTKEEIDYLQNL
ncbi:pseudouridine synthase [Clostridium cellulovorans]|uniref:Pseudouridine synthase n=1 Tax=Clostridium cellulovorans (strain ATCC 35296 / DSM 3052 / OCM 3 / 743B) TaxID=573061 RepID=D9SN20_CLOC7|nr:pseudouridine synthase [Clostridium cellulovorans]ADL51886.1 pseudouridine synthase [Clostridium cellulovorans 743B]